MSQEANNLLLYSAEKGDFYGIIKALNDGANINFAKEWDGTALHIASSKGFLKIVKHLVEKGASTALTFGADFTPLHLAARDGHIEIVKYLLEKGGPYSDRVLKDVGYVASVSTTGNPVIPDIIRRYMVKQKKPDIQDISEEDAELFIAVYNADIEAIYFALESSANINSTDGAGITVLRWAVRLNNEEIVRLLLEKDAEINKTSNMGWTALMEASMNGFTSIVRLLLEYNAEVNIKTTVNGTALYFAAYEGHYEIVKLLLDNGADSTVEVEIWDIVQDYTETALSIAKLHGHKKIVELLEKSMR